MVGRVRNVLIFLMSLAVSSLLGTIIAVPVEAGSSTVIFEDDFEGQDVNCWSNKPNGGGWNFAGCGGFVNIGQGSHVGLAVGEVSHSGKKAIKITFTSNENHGGGEVKLSGYDRIFTRQYDYYERNFDFAYGMKIHRIRSFNGNLNDFDIVSVAWGTPTSGSTNMSGVNDMGNISINANGGPVDWGSAWGGESFQREKWYCVETEVKLNDPGSANGEVRIWIDGNLLVQRTNVNIRGGLSKSINRILFGGWYSNGAKGLNPQPDPAVPSIRYIDDVVISTERVGCLPDVPDKTPPGSPTGVRFSGQQ